MTELLHVVLGVALFLWLAAICIVLPILVAFPWIRYSVERYLDWSDRTQERVREIACAKRRELARLKDLDQSRKETQ